MPTEMSQIKATANAHIRRDVEAGGKWVCDCEACLGMRSLVGVEKTLEVRPLVRQIEEMGKRLDQLPNGLEKEALLEQYLDLHDNLADVMAK
jgi:hypothetical protein